jgi:hypothetical protein
MRGRGAARILLYADECAVCRRLAQRVRWFVRCSSRTTVVATLSRRLA